MSAPEAPNPELQSEIATRVRAGLTPLRASLTQGVDEDTFNRWMELGKQGGRGNSVYMTFREAINQAEAECEVMLLGYIRRAAQDGTWQAAAWLAERLFPHRYVRKSVNGSIGKEESSASAQEDPFTSLDNVTSIAKKRGN